MNIITRGFSSVQNIVTRGFGELVSAIKKKSGTIFRRKRNKYIFDIEIPIRIINVINFDIKLYLLHKIKLDYFLNISIKKYVKKEYNLCLPVNNLRLKRIYKILKFI